MHAVCAACLRGSNANSSDVLCARAWCHVVMCPVYLRCRRLRADQPSGSHQHIEDALQTRAPLQVPAQASPSGLTVRSSQTCLAVLKL